MSSFDRRTSSIRNASESDDGLLALMYPDEEDLYSEHSTWEHEDLARVKIRVNRGHSDSVNSCSFFDDDKRILTASTDKSIKIWDFLSCRVIKDFPEAHSDKINQALATNDGTKLVSVGWDRKVILKDIETGYNLMNGDHVGVVTSCGISHDNHTIISGSDLDNVVKFWDIRSAQIIQNVYDLHASTIMCCIFTPDDTRIITSSTDRSAKVWDIRNKTITLTLQGHSNPVSRCTVSPDGHNVATASWDKTVKVWDIQTGTYRSQGPQTLVKGHDGSVSSCKFSSDNNLLVTGSYDKSIILWDAKNEVQKLQLQGHTDWVEDVDISKNGKWILSAAKDKTMRLWNVEGMDGIAMVQASTRQPTGLSIIQCEKCSKPFPAGQLESQHDDRLCVFCRLQHGRTSVSKDAYEMSTAWLVNMRI